MGSGDVVVGGDDGKGRAGGRANSSMIAVATVTCKWCGRDKRIDSWCDCPTAQAAMHKHDAEQNAIGEMQFARAIQWRCRRCGRLLAIGAISTGTQLVIKCKCSHENVLP